MENSHLYQNSGRFCQKCNCYPDLNVPFQKLLDFKRDLPYFGHLNYSGKEIFFVNRYYKSLGIEDEEWVQYPIPECPVQFYDSNRIPIYCVHFFAEYEMKLSRYADWNLVYSPEDEKRISWEKLKSLLGYYKLLMKNGQEGPESTSKLGSQI